MKRRRLLVRAALVVAVGVCFWSTPCCPHYSNSRAPLPLESVRRGCPIPLPDGARNIQYRSFIFFQAYEQTVRFEAPVDVCLAHIKNVADYWNARHSNSLLLDQPKPIGHPPERSGFLKEQPWFDVENISKGVEVRGAGHLGPQIWIDTQKGVFYFFVTD